MPKVKLPIKVPVSQNVDEIALSSQLSPVLMDGYMDELGNLHRRPGLKNFTTLASAGGVDGMYWWRKGKCVIAVSGGRLYKVISDGTVEDITPAGTYMKNDVRAIFTEDEDRMYTANGNRILHYDGGASHVTGTDGLRYSCILDHTADADKKPITGADWEDYWIQDEVPQIDASYVVGTDINIYVCIQAHTSDGDKVVGSNGQVYTCILTHVATAAKKPVTGADWETYWELRGTTADNWIVGHTYTQSTNRPITGTDWATYWRLEGADGEIWQTETAYVTSSPALWYNAYDYVSAGNASQMVDPEAPINVTHVAFIDGYVLANRKETSLIQFSNLEDGLVWDALDFFSAKTKQDEVTAMSVLWREILAVGKDSMDYYWNDGSTPFSRLEGAYIERGCIAPYSLIFADNTYFWLDNTRRFVRLNGRTPEIISTPFDRIIQGYGTVEDCTADLCEVKGKPWIIWSFPTEGKTLVYDIMLKIWYEWGRWMSGTSSYERWLGNCVVYARDWNKWLIGSRLAGGEIWELDMDTQDDDGGTIRTLRRTALVDQNTMARKKSKAINVKIKRGEGFAAGSPSTIVGSDAQVYTCIKDHTSTLNDKPITGSNWAFYWEQSGASVTAWVVDTEYDAHMPFISFRWRDNNKNAWSNLHQLELGKSGETEVVLSFSRLGIYKTRQWEFIMTDTVPLILCEVEEDVELLDRRTEKSEKED